MLAPVVSLLAAISRPAAVTVWTSKASKTRLPAKASFVEWTDDKTIRFESPGAKTVFLIQAADGRWSVGKTS